MGPTLIVELIRKNWNMQLQVLDYLRVFAKFSELVMAPVKVLKAFYYCGVNSDEIFTNAN